MIGTIALIIDKHGQVLSSHHDFGEQGYASFTKSESQKIRLKEDIAYEFCSDFLPAFLTNNLSADTKKRIVRDLISSNYAKLHLQEIKLPTKKGQDDDA